MTRNLNKEFLLNDWIDFFGIACIALYCLGSSLFTSNFSEIHITLPFLDFPIFIGEVLLFVCLSLFVWKARVRAKFYDWYWYWIAYLIWVMAVALIGYKEWGPLALRNAALFYYVIFALFGYTFFNHKIFTRYPVLNCILFFIVLLLVTHKVVVYFWYTFFVVAIFIVFKRFKGFIRFGLLGSIVLLSGWSNLFLGKRAHMIAVVVAVLFFFLTWSVYLSNHSLRKRVVLAGLLVGVILLGFLKVTDSNSIRSLLGWSTIIGYYNEKNDFLKDRRKWQPEKREKYCFYHPNQDSALTKDEEIHQNLSGVSDDHAIWSPLVDQGKIPAGDKKEKLMNIEKSSMASDHLKGKQDFVLNESSDESDLLNVHREAGRGEGAKVNAGYKRSLGIAYNNILFRVFIWQDMLDEIWRKHPLFGFGFGYPQRSPSIEILNWATSEWLRDGWISPHNFILHIIYRSGLIGCLLILVLFLVIINMIRGLVRHKDVLGLLLISTLVYWIIQSSFSVTLELPHYSIFFWSLFGLVFAYVNQEERTCSQIHSGSRQN